MTNDLHVETALLKAMLSFENYNTYQSYIQRDKLLEHTRILLSGFDHWYKENKERDIDLDEFHTRFAQQWNKELDVRDVSLLREIVYPKLLSVDLKDVNSVISALVEQQYKVLLSDAVKDGEYEIVRELTKELESKLKNLSGDYSDSEEDGYTFKTMDFSVLSKADGIEWCLPTLQKSLGNIVPGELVIIAGDTGAAKGAFVCCQIAQSIKHLQRSRDIRPILLFNSEGVVSEPMNRVFSNLLRKDFLDGFEQICLEQEIANKIFGEMFPDMSEHLWMFSISKINTFSKLKEKVLKYNPAIVFVDIADKLSSDRDYQSLTVLYDDLRGLAEEANCAIIATSQAGNTKYFDPELSKFKWKRWLDDKDIFGAKQKSAAATTMISIGMDSPNDDMRYINISKCKRGNPTKFSCQLTKKYSRLEELDW